MNIMKLVAFLRFLVENKEQLLELIELIRSLVSKKLLIGSPETATLVAAEKYPALSTAVIEAGSSWQDLIDLLLNNIDSLSEFITLLLELLKLFEAKTK